MQANGSHDGIPRMVEAVDPVHWTELSGQLHALALLLQGESVPGTHCKGQYVWTF